MSETVTELYFTDVKSKAVFAANGPKPQFLLNTPNYKALVVGLEAGQEIPAHPEQPAMYHFLEGSGVMSVDGQAFDVYPGATVVAPDGAMRGIKALTRIIFLASKGG